MILQPSSRLSKAWSVSADPGLRQYSKPDDFPRVKNGLGVAIMSTSKGVMTDKEAKAQNVGGEVLCSIFTKNDVVIH
jgi:ribosomal protein S8